MARIFFRFLSESDSHPPPPPLESSAPLNSDLVVTLAALLCALICVLGLIAVSRCTWLLRLSEGNRSSTADSSSPPPPASNKGLKKKVIRSLPKLTHSPETPESERFTECAICLTEFAAGDEIRVLPQCGHGFHVSCVDTWLGSHSSCPSCRQVLVVARCQKCGGLPGSSASGSGSGSGSEPENQFKRHEDDPDTFLP